MSVADKIVIVTGAVQSIGRAAAERFAQEGAVAVVVDLDRARGEATLGVSFEVFMCAPSKRTLVNLFWRHP